MNGFVHALAALLGGKDTATHLMGGWVGLRGCPDDLENSIFSPIGITIPDFQARSLVIIPAEPCRLLHFQYWTIWYSFTIPDIVIPLETTAMYITLYPYFLKQQKNERHTKLRGGGDTNAT
jgi:hypothetical protein